MQVFPFYVSSFLPSVGFYLCLNSITSFFYSPHPLLFLQLVTNILNSNPSPQCIYSPSSLVSAVNLISLLFVPSSKSLTEGLNKTKPQTTFCTWGRLSSPLRMDWFPHWVQIFHRLCACFIKDGFKTIFSPSLYVRMSHEVVVKIFRKASKAKINIYYYFYMQDWLSSPRKNIKSSWGLLFISLSGFQVDAKRLPFLVGFLWLWLTGWASPFLPESSDFMGNKIIYQLYLNMSALPIFPWKSQNVFEVLPDTKWHLKPQASKIQWKPSFTCTSPHYLPSAKRVNGTHWLLILHQLWKQRWG